MLQKRVDECKATEREAREPIQYLQEAAAAKDIDELKGVILNSDKLREPGSERVRVMGACSLRKTTD